MHFNNLLMLTNSVMLTISGCDTSRPPSMWFRPFANNVLRTINGVLVSCHYCNHTQWHNLTNDRVIFLLQIVVECASKLENMSRSLEIKHDATFAHTM
jgi:hypothetical protein